MGNKERIGGANDKKLEVPNWFQVKSWHALASYRYSIQEIRPVSHVWGVMAVTLSWFPIVKGGAPADAFNNCNYDINKALKGDPCKVTLLGDHSLASEPREFSSKLLEDVRCGGTERLLDTRVGKLTNYVLKYLEKNQQTDEDAKRYLGDYLESLIVDYDRRQERQALRAEELDEHYSRMNDGFYNTRLVLAGAGFRTSDLPDFSRQMGQLRATNNLYGGWKRGEINVPQEVLEDAGVDPTEGNREITDSPLITEWRHDTASDAVKALKLAVYDMKYGMEWDSRMRRSLIREARSQISKASRCASLTNN